VPQPFDIDVEVGLDLAAAQRSDVLADTVDYAALHAAIIGIVASTSYDLIERIARDILDLLFSDRRIVRAEVSIGKPRLLAGATPVVTVRQSR
jgi:dihydroneopterin aldolase